MRSVIVCAVWIAATSSASRGQEGEFFLRIHGVEGGSRVEGYQGWIEADSFEFVATSQTISGIGGGLVGVTPARLSGLRVNARLDQASPVLFDRIMRQDILQEVELRMTVVDRDQRFPIETWMFGDVWLTEFRRSGAFQNTYTFAFDRGMYCFYGEGGIDPTCAEFNAGTFSPDLFLAQTEYRELPELQAGDADQDLDFDQLDLVLVQQSAKYLTVQLATWGEGDWDGGPGGYPGEPPPGDGLFDQKDIVAALQTGTYLNSAYAAISPGGVRGDEQTSIVYHFDTGELEVNAPVSTKLTSINIDSAAGIFTGDKTLCNKVVGGFDWCTSNNILMASFGGSFRSLSWGNVAQTRLSEDFVANDLTVVGSVGGGGDLGDVDLIYIPEPSSLLLALLGIIGPLHWRR